MTVLNDKSSCNTEVHGETYFLVLLTGILIDDPGRRTLSATISKGKRLGILIDDAMFFL